LGGPGEDDNGLLVACRRLECYQCYTARPANPQRVTTDLSEPSNILKVSGLEPQTRWVRQARLALD